MQFNNLDSFYLSKVVILVDSILDFQLMVELLVTMNVGLSVGRAARLPDTPNRPSHLPNKDQMGVD